MCGGPRELWLPPPSRASARHHPRRAAREARGAGALTPPAKPGEMACEARRRGLLRSIPARRAMRNACARMAGSGSALKRAMARKRRFISNGVAGHGPP